MEKTSTKIANQYDYFMFDDSEKIKNNMPLIIYDYDNDIIIDGYHRLSLCLNKINENDKINVFMLSRFIEFKAK